MWRRLSPYKTLPQAPINICYQTQGSTAVRTLLLPDTRKHSCIFSPQTGTGNAQENMQQGYYRRIYYYTQQVTQTTIITTAHSFHKPARATRWKIRNTVQQFSTRNCNSQPALLFLTTECFRHDLVREHLHSPGICVPTVRASFHPPYARVR